MASGKPQPWKVLSRRSLTSSPRVLPVCSNATAYRDASSNTDNGPTLLSHPLGLLKSICQSWFGCSRSNRNSAGQRRSCSRTNPSRSNTRCTVAAGTTTPCCFNGANSFRAPQSGRTRRTSAIRCSISVAVRLGDLCGRRLCSRIPASPANR
jgi:hypothetical protein